MKLPSVFGHSDPHRTSARFFAGLTFLISLACLSGFFSGCSSGAGTNPAPSPAPSISAPSQLVYARTSIDAVAGTAIPPDVPAVTGTVSTYTVNPALPAGLTLDGATGVIAGTPTAVSAQANYTVTAANSGGATTTTVQIQVTTPVVAPSQLSYIMPVLTLTVGQTIVPELALYSGSRATFSVSPALPAGINVDPATGTLSGMPTAISAQLTNYTVTATNAAGSTTTGLEISVAPPGPAASLYPQASLVAMVGQPIPQELPIMDGTGYAFSVSPALPPGITLNPSSGLISGTPTAVSAPTIYLILATTPAGPLYSALTITVSQPLNVLLNLGHAGSMTTMRATATRLLSQNLVSVRSTDGGISPGHWVLWDRTTRAELASGDQPRPAVIESRLTNVWPVDMAGPTLAIGISNAVELRSASDGHLLTTVIAPSLDPRPGTPAWWKLASDGSYLCAGSSTGLTLWDLSGAVLVARAGDYSTAVAFAAPGEVRVGLGPAGANRIETISTTGTSSVGSAFSGTFNTWFLDGEKFLTNTGTTVWTYSKAGVQVGIAALATVENLTGQGNWIWTYAASTFNSGYPLTIYPVGGSTPAATYLLPTTSQVIPSGLTLGVLPSGPAGASVIDLSGATLAKVDYTLPTAYNTSFAATSAADWLVGNTHGVVLDGPSTLTSPTFYGFGAAWSVAGSQNRIAVATANGTIQIFDATSSTLQQTIPFSSSKIALSSDGTILAAAANMLDSVYEPDRSLRIYSLPSGTVMASIPYKAATGTQQSVPQLFDFSLATGGTALGTLSGFYSGTSWTYTRQITPLSGSPVIYADHPADTTNVPRLSPDGTLAALTTTLSPMHYSTSLFKNGQVVTAVPGLAYAWLDNNRLYLSSELVDASGATLVTFGPVQTVAATSGDTRLPTRLNAVYSTQLNAIFSLVDGQTLWSSPFYNYGEGAVTNNTVVFPSGTRVFTDTY